MKAALTRIEKIFEKRQKVIKELLWEGLGKFIGNNIPQMLESKLAAVVRLHKVTTYPPDKPFSLSITSTEAEELLRNWELYSRERREVEVTLFSPNITAVYIIVVEPLPLFLYFEMQAGAKLIFTPAIYKGKKTIIEREIRPLSIYFTRSPYIESPSGRKASLYAPRHFLYNDPKPTDFAYAMPSEEVIEKIAKEIKAFVGALHYPAGVLKLVHHLIDVFMKKINDELMREGKSIYINKKDVEIEISSGLNITTSITFKFPTTIEDTLTGSKKSLSIVIEIMDIEGRSVTLDFRVGLGVRYRDRLNIRREGEKAILELNLQEIFTPEFVDGVIDYIPRFPL